MSVPAESLVQLWAETDRQTDMSTPAPGLEKKPSRFRGWRLHLLFPWPALIARDSHSHLKADLSSFWESYLQLRREQGRQEAVNVRQGECFQRDRASKAVVPKVSSLEAGKAALLLCLPISALRGHADTCMNGLENPPILLPTPHDR